jgi:hypothetical protein
VRESGGNAKASEYSTILKSVQIFRQESRKEIELAGVEIEMKTSTASSEKEIMLTSFLMGKRGLDSNAITLEKEMRSYMMRKNSTSPSEIQKIP